MKREINILVPKLRFKEFEGEWRELKLSAFLKRYSENNRDEEFGINDILSLSSVYGVVDRRKLLEDTYNNVNHRNYIKTRLNDLVYGKSISTSYPYGLFKVNNCRDGLLSTLYFTYKVSDFVLPNFIDKHFSHINRANNFLRKYVLVGDRYITADSDYILSGKVFIPSFSEQQKIASFLTAVDKRIEQLTKKKKLLEEYKKGVMQKIFNQEVRFKDENGNDFPEWEEKRLGEIADINKGTQKNVELLSEKGSYPVINGGKEPSGYFNDFNTIENTITISEGGNSCGFINYIESKFWSGGHCYTLTTNDKINKDYLYHYLKHNQAEIMKLRVGSGLPNIQKKDIEKFGIIAPCLKEQELIAQKISNLKKQLQRLDKIIQQVKIFKQGLLQQMFI